MHATHRPVRIAVTGLVIAALALGCVETPATPAASPAQVSATGLPSLTPEPTASSTDASSSPLVSPSPSSPEPSSPEPASPSPSAPPAPTLATVLATLKVAAEDRTGYRRSLFRLWVDADGNGCDTREEVLIAEAVTAPTMGAACALSSGAWFSEYDGLTIVDPGKLDIDHMVPLAEAWDSGASAWSPTRRKLFANDVGVSWALIAVSAASNRSKGDKDPADWLPPRVEYRCTYLAVWVAIKARWDLAVDTAEKKAIKAQAACQDMPVPGP